MQFDPSKIGFAEELGSATQIPATKRNKKQTAKPSAAEKSPVAKAPAAKKPTAATKTDAVKEIPTDVEFSFEPQVAEETAPELVTEPTVEKSPFVEDAPIVEEAPVVEAAPETTPEPTAVEPIAEPELVAEPELIAEPELVAELELVAEPENINLFSNAAPETASEGAVDLSALAAKDDADDLLADDATDTTETANTDDIDTVATEKDNTTETATAADAAVANAVVATDPAVAAAAVAVTAAIETSAVAETPAATETPAVAETPAATETSAVAETANTTEATAKKDGFFIRALKFFIPWKGDPAKELFRKLVFLVALVVFIGAFSYLAVYLNDRLKYEASINYAEELVNQNDTTVGTDQIMNKYRDLYNDNNDFCGWITIPNTNVDGAIYQTLNNSYYINHNGQKKSSIYGAYFADYKCTIAAEGSSQNITVYGHHMRDQTMFAQIRKYKDISFYKENPTLTFDTLYSSSKYKVFAAFITNADPADDNGYFFDFAVQGFINQEDFLAWIEQVRRRSIINTAVDVVEGDDILTLSTCTYELGTSMDMRFVVMARKVRDGETETVNVADATQNATPLYPAAWYKRFGSKKPVFEDGLYTWGETSSVQQEIIEQVIIPPTSSETSSETSSMAQSIPSFQNPFYSSSAAETSSGWYTPEIVNPWDEEAESFVNPWDNTSATTSFNQSTDNNPQYNF